MLDGFPNYHYFDNGNGYSGSEGGMRYFIDLVKKNDPVDESGKKKIKFLKAVVWPEPWSMEHTFDSKKSFAEFPGSQQGLDDAIAWVRERYTAEPERWAKSPSILDCEPDIPDPANPPEDPGGPKEVKPASE